MSRPDQLPDQYLVRELNELLALSAELKSATQRFGSSSAKTTVVQSGLTYDIEVTDIRFNNRIIEVSYVAADRTLGDGIVLGFDYVDSYSVAGSVQVYLEDLEPSGSTQKWRLYLSGSDVAPTSWGRFKFYLFAFGDGAFSATLV